LSDWEPSEFRRLINIDNIEQQGRTFSIEAGLQERSALARRFGVLSIESLVARGTLVPCADHSRIRLRASLEAEVVQQCVVSLQALMQRINVDFSREYDRDMVDEWAGLGDDGGEIFFDLNSDELPEPVVGGDIDLGEVVAEQLALELDPFPRASRAKLDELALRRGKTNVEGEPANPFAVLASPRVKLKKG